MRGAPTPACTRGVRSSTPTSTALPDGPERLARRLNGVLGDDVRVQRAVEAPDGFDARFSALWRRYAYRVADRPEVVDPLSRGQVLAWRRPVDEAVMNAAALALVGEHDFAAFCKQREGATTIRNLIDLHWEREPDGLLVAHVRADAFCHSMVRSLVGCLLAVGDGRRAVRVGGRRAGCGAARLRGDRRTRARAHPRGGRATRRTPSWPRASRSPGPGVAEDEHYFSADPSVPFRRMPVTASVWGHSLSLDSGSGVFAQGRVDVGTAVLFRETSAPAAGRVLDLGCGYGVIGLAIATAVPGARVTGVDVNERAVLLANENAAALGVADRFTATTPPGVPAEATYDELWSNPPIRIGKAALHELLLTWLPRLVPGGRAVLVVGKNLGADSLQRWLGEQGYPTARIASAKGFRVLETRRP